VNWFKRLFSNQEYEVVETEVPLTTILRWYLYDTSFEEQNAIAELVGLTPISEEGEAKELEDSEIRLQNINTILPYLDAMSDISSKFMTTMHLRQTEELRAESGDDLSEEDIEAMMSIYKNVAFAALVGTFSIGLNLGLIQLTGVTSEPKDTGGFFDEQL